MAERKRTRSRGWALAVLGLVAVPGFALGLFAGIAWEDPSLVAGHLLGRTRVVAWEGSVGDDVDSLPDVAALPGGAPRALPRKRKTPSVTRLRPEVLTPGGAAGGFAVQVGAFSESGTADRLAESLRTKGYVVYVSPGTGSGATRWRVRVGPHPSREEADRAAKRLKAEEKLPTWVLDEDAAG